MSRRRGGFGNRADAGSFRRQLVLSTALLGALVAAALILVVQFALSGSATASVDRVLSTRADALIQTINNATKGSTPTVPRSQLDPGVAVYDGDGQLIAGDVPDSQADDYLELADTRGVESQRLGDAFVLRAKHFTTKSGAVGVMVLSERLDPYQDQEQDALGVSILAGAVIVLLATGIANWLSKRALAPVAEMARTAEMWSEHDLDRRFGFGPPTNELKALAHTLDDLLDKVASAILAEQRLTSELAHELRSPLTTIQGTADLMAMRTDLDADTRDDIEEIRASCRSMAATITGLLELARTQTPLGGAATTAVSAAVDEAVAGLGANKDTVRVDIPADLRAGAPKDLVVRILAPILDNAVRLASTVQVSARPDDAHVRIRVADDGPGIPIADAERVFEAGHTTGSGSGLGLALSRRIARTVGGDVALDPPRAGRSGATFVVSLPLR